MHLSAADIDLLASPGAVPRKVVSCAADGQVRSSVLSAQSSRLLHRHNGRAHRLCLEPGSSRAFLSCGEDGLVFRYDLRQSERRRLMTLRDEDGDVLPCYAMSVDPLRPVNFILGGTSTFVQLFDARNPSHPVARFCPMHLRRGRQDHVTGTAFDWTGREFVATYNDEHVYRFHVDKDAVVEDEGRAAEGQEREREKKREVGTRATRAAAAMGGAAAQTEDDDRKEAGDGDGEDEEEGEEEEKLGYRRKYTGHRNDQTVKQVRGPVLVNI
jgi:WD40 repeat protein